MERHKQQRRQWQLTQAQQHSSRPAALLHKLWVRGSNMATDHLRNVLILSVFGFKVGAVFHPVPFFLSGPAW